MILPIVLCSAPSAVVGSSMRLRFCSDPFVVRGVFRCGIYAALNSKLRLGELGLLHFEELEGGLKIRRPEMAVGVFALMATDCAHFAPI
jgi:hypothetical protein